MLCWFAVSAKKVVNLKIKKAGESDARNSGFPAVYSDAPLISWQARDHIPRERTTLWYAAILGGGAVILFWALWTFNFLFAFFTVAAVVALFVVSSRNPQPHRIEIFPAGIEIEGLPRINFSELESFWIFPEVTPPLLFLRPRHRIKFPTYLLLENIDAEKVREILLNYIPEKEGELNFLERLSHRIGF
jgi:hypothetical protein